MSRETPLPPITEELLRRFEEGVTHYAARVVELAGARPGNPRGLRTRWFGSAFAAAATAARELDFMNRVHNLTATDIEALPDILSFYAEAGVRPWFEVVPTAGGTASVGAALATAGAIPLSNAMFVYGAPTDVLAGAESTPIARRIAVDEAAVFADTMLRGHEVPEQELPRAADELIAWASEPGWSLSVATVSGEPAAAAVLQVRDGLGYLANMATLPRFRGRGCQRELIALRAAEAAQAGCDLVAAQATLGSVSQRNLQRAGLSPAFTITTWRLGPHPPTGV
jgi:GNAT superfamily N-acetyltransferase